MLELLQLRELTSKVPYRPIWSQRKSAHMVSLARVDLYNVDVIVQAYLPKVHNPKSNIYVSE